MKFGTMITTAQRPGTEEADVFEQSRRSALEAERLGYDEVWILEHHFTRYGLCPSAITMAAHLLGLTSRVAVGTAISILPLDHPLRLAEQVALLDQLAPGRFRFGVGRGLFRRDFEVFGVDMARSHEIVREWVDILQRAWTGEPVSHDSDLVSFPSVTVRPRPRTRPHPPLYVAATSKDTVRWAAGKGLPMLLNWRIPDEQKVQQMELYAEVAAESGHDPALADHAMSCIASVGDTQEEAIGAVRDGLEWWVYEGVQGSGLINTSAARPTNYDRYHREITGVLGNSPTSASDLVNLILRLNPVGTPERCVERLEELSERLGLWHFMIGFEGADSEAWTLESMGRFAREVMPRVARTVVP